MHARSTYISSILVAAAMMAAGPGRADPGAGDFEGLSGRIFAVEATVVYSDDPTFPAGTVFNNCYSFNADGSWFDPLYPDLGVAVPGVWVQYADLPKIAYSATVSESAVAGGPFEGLLLTQNGVVNQSKGEGRQKLLAYTTVWFAGWPIIDVAAEGHAVDSCPYF